MLTSCPRPHLLGTAVLVGVLAALAGCADTEDKASAARTEPQPSVSPGAESSSSAPSAASFPVTVRSCGRDVTIERAPERALLGFPTSITTLDALGVGGSAIGYVTGSAGRPSAPYTDLAEVSPDYQPGREVVLAARPDLFVSNDENQLGGENGISRDDLEEADTDVYVLGGYCVSEAAPASVDAVIEDVLALGKVFGVGPRAEELSDSLRNRVREAAALRGDQPIATAAFVQVYDGKLYALSGSYYAAILAGAGVANEFDDLKENFAEISAEQVLIRHPDLIFVAYEGTDSTEALADARELLAETPAVDDGRVYALSSLQISGGGVNIIEMIEQAARDAYAR